MTLSQIKQKAVHLYVQERLSSVEIAFKLGKSKQTITRYLREFGVTRSKSEARTLSTIGDVVGQRFGRLEIMNLSGQNNSRQTKVQCRCDCGATRTFVYNNLKNGKARSCGCLQKEIASKRFSAKLNGQVFGRLTVLNRVETKANRPIWNCKCSCGKHHLANSHDLKFGDVKSCGCLSSGNDSVSAWLNGVFCRPEDEAFFYVFEMANYVDLSKPGIAISLQKRADDQYGALHDFIILPRLDAWLIEQAVLTETRSYKYCPSELVEWGGRTELRRLTPEHLFSLACDFHNALERMGREAFAIQYLPTTPKQRKQLKTMQQQLVAA